MRDFVRKDIVLILKKYFGRMSPCILRRPNFLGSNRIFSEVSFHVPSHAKKSRLEPRFRHWVAPGQHVMHHPSWNFTLGRMQVRESEGPCFGPSATHRLGFSCQNCEDPASLKLLRKRFSSNERYHIRILFALPMSNRGAYHAPQGAHAQRMPSGVVCFNPFGLVIP